MFVVIEGADNSGKSTLARYLGGLLQVGIRHSGGPPKSPAEMNDRIAELLDTPRPIIFDRFPVISEQVYGPILGREDLIQPHHVGAFLAKDPIIIYCRPPLSVLLDLNAHEVKAHETLEHVQSVQRNALALIAAYDRVMLPFQPIIYDHTSGGPQMRDLLLRYLSERRAA